MLRSICTNDLILDRIGTNDLIRDSIGTNDLILDSIGTNALILGGKEPVVSGNFLPGFTMGLVCQGHGHVFQAGFCYSILLFFFSVLMFLFIVVEDHVR
jgi:hypothetical protein